MITFSHSFYSQAYLDLKNISLSVIFLIFHPSKVTKMPVKGLPCSWIVLHYMVNPGLTVTQPNHTEHVLKTNPKQKQMVELEC